MTDFLFDLANYRLRKLDMEQGYKPLDFGGNGITGSVNKDGRLIAVNAYHPEHGYMTLTSIPPFPDEDRYDQAKVRAYRKSLVPNAGFGLEFEQEIVKREYYLIEDAIPFMRFTLADGTIAACVTAGRIRAEQFWRFSRDNVQARYTGNVWLMRVAYTQLTEGGVLYMPNFETVIDDKHTHGEGLLLRNHALGSSALFKNALSGSQNPDGSICLETPLVFRDEYHQMVNIDYTNNHLAARMERSLERWLVEAETRTQASNKHLFLSRASVYADICQTHTSNGEAKCILTDHMILPLSWNRDAYYTAKVLMYQSEDLHYYLTWLLDETWRGTYCHRLQKPMPDAWGRSYMANGQQKDSRAYQLDQQIFPLLLIADIVECDTNGGIDGDTEPDDIEAYKPFLERFILRIFANISRSDVTFGLYVTDETPADDDIPMSFHFSSHTLLWYALKRIKQFFPDSFNWSDLVIWMDAIREQITKYFITEHNGKQIYSYATDGEGNHYLYHDANDIPLVMMPLWGFCEKDDPIWLNTIDFAWSDDNIGCYKGHLGSVHTPNAAWSLGDAQELIFCKVVGDRDRYQRVWERIEKSAQWDGALPEAYDTETYEVVSRHWFAWPNAMVAIADSISWDWKTEGEYAR